LIDLIFGSIPEEEEPMVKRDVDYERELQQFISDSFEAWGWDSEEWHENLISTLAEQLHNPDNTKKEQEWIRMLIKALKNEQATFKKKLTREYILKGVVHCMLRPPDANCLVITGSNHCHWFGKQVTTCEIGRI
jgi:hypothetical protein